MFMLAYVCGLERFGRKNRKSMSKFDSSGVVSVGISREILTAGDRSPGKL